jgi:glucose dehydrogenase
MNTGRHIPLLAVVSCGGFLVLSQEVKTAPPAEWAYGGNAAGTRYSALKQINRANVGRLREAWRFDATGGGGTSGLQTQPLVANGIVYGNTPAGAVVALDGASGKLVWSWDSKSGGQRVRGYTWWSDGTEARIFAGVGRYVYALNAKTGEPVAGFAGGGRIDLHRDLDRDP